MTTLVFVGLLKDRASFFDILQTFIAELQTQFSTLPKILRTDNALEFIQTSVESFCSSHGIVHHLPVYL
mgnify:CR=1 FL=1